VIFVHDVKKDFYKKFMHEPFPVESSLHTQLANHFNAEIVAGTITSKQVRRAVFLLCFPLCDGWYAASYHPFPNAGGHGVPDVDVFLPSPGHEPHVLQPGGLVAGRHQPVPVRNGSWVSSDEAETPKTGLCTSVPGPTLSLITLPPTQVEDTIWELIQSSCVEVGDDNLSLEPDTLGRIASYYYLEHKTMRLFSSDIDEDMDIPAILKVIDSAAGQCIARFPGRLLDNKLLNETL
jgi:hypothetical protein